MTIKENIRLALALGPATRDQLDRWADEHDRAWERIVSSGVVIFGLGLFCLAGLATTEALLAFKDARPSWGTSNPAFSGLWWLGLLGLIVSLACALAICWLWWHFIFRRDLRPVNPYRPIDISLADLEKPHAAYPRALAYLDAIRHQRRPVVQHDIDVLAMIRRQQKPNRGGSR